MITLADYAIGTGQDPNDPATQIAYGQLVRELNRGKHVITCSGYNERQCDCGQVDDIEARAAHLRLVLSNVMRHLEKVAATPDERRDFDAAWAELRRLEEAVYGESPLQIERPQR